MFQSISCICHVNFCTWKKSCIFNIFQISSNLESSRTMSFSAPSAINMEHTVVKFDAEVEKFNISKSGDQLEDGESSNHENVHAEDVAHDWQSLSNLTESTEQSAPINFDMSNRVSLK